MLEPRMVFDGAAADTVAKIAPNDVHAAPQSQQPDHSAHPDAIDLAAALVSAPTSAEASPHEIAFIVGNVSNAQELIKAIPASVEIVMLDAGSDGVKQIAEVLSHRHGINAIHILSHGSEGNLILGTARLNTESMQADYSAELSTIKAALSDNADILIYGCDFAKGVDGAAAASELARLTGADVAASIDDTGAAARGGNWVLENRTGTIEARTIDAAAWDGLLAPLTISTTAAPIVTGATGIDPLTGFASGGVGMTGLWVNAGTIGSTSVDIKATVLSLSASTVSFFTQGDDLAIILNGGATATIKWEVFASGTAQTVYAVGSPHFQIADIDGVGGVINTRETVRPQLSGLTGYTLDNPTNLVATTSASGVAISGTQNQNSESTSLAAFDWQNVSSWTVEYTLNGASGFSNAVFRHDGDGDFTFVSAVTTSLLILDLDANNSTATGTSYQKTFTKNGAAVAVADSDTTIAQNAVLGTTLGDASIVLTNAKVGDELTVGTLPAGITASVDTSIPGQITVTLSGVASVASYQTAIAAVQFSNSSATPDATDRTISISVTNETFGTTSNTAVSTIHVVAVNDAPAGADKAITLNEDTSYTLATADFGFSDVDGNSLLSVKIDSLPSSGTLAYNGVAITAAQITAGYFVTAADIADGKLVYTPGANADGTPLANFTFQVTDNGGTANGGVDTDPTPNTVTFNVTPVNDAPAGADKTVTINEDASYTLATADFGFSDVDGNSLVSVKIDSLPASGTLAYNGVAITAAQITAGYFVTTADIAAGKLVYTPPADANSTALANFTFQVTDDGGTANGGVDTDPIANRITINVTAVDDPISAVAPLSQTTPEDTALVFSTANVNAIVLTDPDGGSANDVIVRFQVPANVGTLQLGSTSGLLSVSGNGTNEIIVTGSVTAINAAINGLRFTPTADWNGAVPSNLSVTMTRPSDLGFLNAGFEQPAYAGGVNFANDATVPGWKTSATDHLIEIWSHGAIGVTAFEGFQFAELNANQVSTLSQTFTPTHVGGELTLTFAHRGRAGTDVMNVTAIDLGADGVLGGGDDTILFTQNYSDGNTAWRQYQADIGTATGNPILLKFVSVSSTGGATIGNFLDAISIYDSSLSTTVSVAISVTPVADAVDDAVTTFEDTAKTFNVITGTNGASADNFENASRTLTAVTQGAHGSVTFEADGSVTYTPNANYAGTDTFTYTVTSPTGVTETANVTMTVVSVNNAPAGADNTVTLNEDASYTLAAADFGFSDPNDTPANALLSVKIDSLPTTGTLAYNGVAITAAQITAGYFVTAADITAGKLVYTPAANANGTALANFTFQVKDNGGTANGGVDLDPTPNRITFDVTPVNDPPTSTDDSVTTPEDTPKVLALTDFGTYADTDGDAIAAVKITTLETDGSLEYFNGTSWVPVSANQVISAAEIAAGKLRFVPDADENGSPYATIGFQISDGSAFSSASTLTVHVTPVNDPPVALADTNAGTEQQLLSGNLITGAVTSGIGGGGTDSDIDGGALSITALTNGSVGSPVSLTYGSLTIQSNGSYTFAPNATANALDEGEIVTEQVTYTVSDGNGGSAQATLTLTITGQNDAPINALAIPASTATDGGSVNIPTFSAFSDPDGEQLTFSLGAGAPTWLSIDPDTGIITGTPPSDASWGGPLSNGVYSIGVVGTDPQGASVTVFAQLTVANLPPVALDDAASVGEDAPSVAGNLIANDHDTAPDQDPLAIEAASQGGTQITLGVPFTTAGGGSLTLNPDGSYTFLTGIAYNGLDVGETATETVAYTLTDGNGATSSALLVITVIGANDAPVAVDDTGQGDQDRPIKLIVLDNDSDADGDSLTIVAANSPNGKATVAADGSLIFQPDFGFAGETTVSYVVSDGHGGFATATVHVTVRAAVIVDPMPSEAPKPIEQIGSPEPLTVDGFVLDALEGVHSLNALSGRLTERGIVIAAANQSSFLNGIAAAEISKELQSHDTSIWQSEQSVNHPAAQQSTQPWDVQGLTGFSLRMGLLDSSGQDARSQVVIESLVRDRTLIVQISSTVQDEGKTIQEYRIAQANGRPLPAWLQRTSPTLLIGQRPAQLESIDLKVTVIYTDGSFEEKAIHINTMSGDVQPLAAKRNGGLPRPFWEQFARAEPVTQQGTRELAEMLR